MPATRHLCPLYVAIDGSEALRSRLGEGEALQALERCFNRLERAISSHHGRVVKLAGHQLLAAFDTAHHGLLAACDIQSRVERLPAVSGIKLGASIGLHYGPALDNTNDAGGDTVRLALRLMQLAHAGQVLTSSDCVAMLPESARRAILALENTQVKLHGQVLAVHAVVWQTLVTHDDHDAEQYAISSAPHPQAQPTAPTARPSCLYLTHGQQTHLVDASHPHLSLGRDPRCTLVLQTAHASRQHARIERRGQDFVLIDHSTNGTQVSPAGRADYLLRHDEILLQGHGCITIGLLAADAAADEHGAPATACERILYRLD